MQAQGEGKQTGWVSGTEPRGSGGQSSCIPRPPVSSHHGLTPTTTLSLGEPTPSPSEVVLVKRRKQLSQSCSVASWGAYRRGFLGPNPGF